MVTAIEGSMSAVRLASNILVVERSHGFCGDQGLNRTSINFAVRVPGLIQLDDHERLWRVVANAADEAALRRTNAARRLRLTPFM